MVLVAVLGSIAVGLGVILVVSLDAIDLLGKAVVYVGTQPSLRPEMRREIIGETVGIVDGYLLTAIMIVFGLGLYELFISRIEALDRLEMGAHLLRVRSVDDLKDRLGRVVLIVVVVKFCQQALELKYGSPADLLYLAVATGLIAGALYLSSKKAAPSAEP
jgi:uncharacterized membrane protein YqhA